MPLQRDGVTGFRGGMRTIGDNRDKDAGEAELIQNFRVDTSGGLIVRDGSRLMHTGFLGSPSRIRGLYYWEGGPDGVDRLLATAGSTLYSAQVDGLPVTFSSIGTGLFSVVNKSFAALRDASGEVVYIADGLGIHKSDGTTLTTSVVTGSYDGVIAYNRRLFAWDTNSSRLYWSDLDNGDTLGDATNGGGSAIIRTFGGGNITGCAVVGRSLFVFHEAGISRFQGWTIDDIDIESGAAAVNNPVGALGMFGIVTFGGFVYFIGADKRAYRVSEGGDVQLISPQVDFGFGGAAGGTTGIILSATDSKNHEVWFMQENVADAPVWVYNVLLGCWYTFKPSLLSGNATFLASIPRGADDLGGEVESAIAMGDSDGRVRIFDHPLALDDADADDGENGTAFSCQVLTKPLDFGDASLMKSMRWAYLGSSAHGDFSIHLLDEDDTATQVGAFAVGFTGNGRVKRVPAWGKYGAPRVRVTYSNGDGDLATVSDIWLGAYVLNRPE